MEIKQYPSKIYIGRNQNENIYLTAPSWDCGWYWGFGYLGNSRCHYHVDGLETAEWYDTEKQCFQSKRLNLFDGFKEHFGSSLVVKDKELWTLCELFKTFYALKETAEVLGRGGSHMSSNPCAAFIKNEKEVKRINEKVMPKLFDEIYKILAPEWYEENCGAYGEE